MINSRKAIWADNLRCAHVLKLPQAALVFFCVRMCMAMAAEIYIVHSWCAWRPAHSLVFVIRAFCVSA